MAIAIKAAPTPDVIWQAMTLMKSFTADGGRKLGLVPDLIVAPSTLEKTLTRILERELYEENGVAVTNELKGKFELLEAHQL